MRATDDPPEPLRAFVDEYRSRTLWFAPIDYYPENPAEWLRVLEQVEKNGDLAAFRRAAAIRTWLSLNTNAASAV
jgi:hypothetical protein